MKLVDNSQQFDQSPTLEQSFQSAINEGAAVNVFALAQQFKNTNPAFKKPQLVEERTSLETEQLWKKRLSMLLDACVYPQCLFVLDVVSLIRFSKIWI